MKPWIKYGIVAIGIILLLVLAIWGPEKLSSYQDQYTMNKVAKEELESTGEGYRYELTSNEKLYILSMCLMHQEKPETEQSKNNRLANDNMIYEDLAGSYAFIINKKGPTDKEIKEEEIYEICNREMKELKKRGVLPNSIKEIEKSAYEAQLYSAIDVMDPRNNMPVWKVSLYTSQQNADKSNRLLDAYVDAKTGKIYEFYVRIEDSWEDLKPEEMIKSWSEYLELEGMTKDITDNPLLETTPYFERFSFPGMENGHTKVTIGFYEGINELFLKITE